MAGAATVDGVVRVAAKGGGGTPARAARLAPGAGAASAGADGIGATVACCICDGAACGASLGFLIWISGVRASVATLLVCVGAVCAATWTLD